MQNTILLDVLLQIFSGVGPMLLTEIIEIRVRLIKLSIEK